MNANTILNKNEVMEYYNILSNHPTNENNVYRNYLFNILVSNGWLNEYIEKYPNPFGL